jgi:hypothetical protein
MMGKVKGYFSFFKKQIEPVMPWPCWAEMGTMTSSDGMVFSVKRMGFV